MQIRAGWAAVALSTALALVGTMSAVPALAAGHQISGQDSWNHHHHNKDHHHHDRHHHGRGKKKKTDRLVVSRSMGRVTRREAEQLGRMTLAIGTASSEFKKGAAYTVYTVRVAGRYARWSGMGSVTVSDNDGTLTPPADLYYLPFHRFSWLPAPFRRWGWRPDPFMGDRAPYNAATIGQSSSFRVPFIDGTAQFAVFDGQIGSGPVAITVADAALKASTTVTYPDNQTSTTTVNAAYITSNVPGATNVTAGVGLPITFTLTNANGQPVANAPVTFGVTNTLKANDLSGSVGTTNANGQVMVT